MENKGYDVAIVRTDIGKGHLLNRELERLEIGLFPALYLGSPTSFSQKAVISAGGDGSRSSEFGFDTAVYPEDVEGLLGLFKLEPGMYDYPRSRAEMVVEGFEHMPTVIDCLASGNGDVQSEYGLFLERLREEYKTRDFELMRGSVR